MRDVSDKQVEPRLQVLPLSYTILSRNDIFSFLSYLSGRTTALCYMLYRITLPLELFGENTTFISTGGEGNKMRNKIPLPILPPVYAIKMQTFLESYLIHSIQNSRVFIL